MSLFMIFWKSYNSKNELNMIKL